MAGFGKAGWVWQGRVGVVGKFWHGRCRTVGLGLAGRGRRGRFGGVWKGWLRHVLVWQVGCVWACTGEARQVRQGTVCWVGVGRFLAGKVRSV